jgi:hypothetical protein
MSLPATRGEWSAMMSDTLRKAEREVEREQRTGEEDRI